MIFFAVLAVLGLICIIGFVVVSTGALVNSRVAKIAGGWMFATSILLAGIFIIVSVFMNYVSAENVIAGASITGAGLVACCSAAFYTYLSLSDARSGT